MIRILHLTYDFSFINFVINSFEENPNCVCEYITVTKEGSPPENIAQHDRLRSIAKQELSSEQFKQFAKSFDGILFHSLSLDFSKFLSNLETSATCIWLPWGADFYQTHPELKNNLLLPQTLKLDSRLKGIKRYNDKLKQILSVLGIRKNEYQHQEEALKKIKYIAPVISEDYELIKKHFQNTENASFLKFCYGNTNTFSEPKARITGNNILLGNSASPTNNHIEAIDFLSKTQLEDKLVITPLTYGNKNYANHIEEYGKHKLGKNFHALRRHMSLSDYITTIRSCSIYILNHRRQQALGNIYAMLYLGAKLLIRKDNPTFTFLQKAGIVFDELDTDPSKPISPLSTSSATHNRQTLDRMISPEKTKENTQNIVNAIKSNSTKQHA
ncbi:TDP-N-acetylfucosamine:lipid II N-acetylfucosaminyltransferase [Pelagicoccus sp. NFK12]|uniref:TDP-N-acetylfucosamine:lipid II N-acetylfucosaminyltransferase n=1 Tax=Pelagicoccus enzymogenes TaxID=2773457 RepID=A0A927FD19_9BACT|nr:TDP-N-acetylfucosamine:lipid II N-acetylfucosaminyltransferase [Pelagicoccus enzymogenes]MBD5781460.1 TDP-N-acetylfucosamine:lipid II N-acetylfucosaminyltransferase [Pelagicoccus enzymogenes]